MIPVTIYVEYDYDCVVWDDDGEIEDNNDVESDDDNDVNRDLLIITVMMKIFSFIMMVNSMRMIMLTMLRVTLIVY